MSKEAYDSLKELMKSGQLSSVLAQVKDEVDAELDAAFEPSSYGSMHDGSKRRLCACAPMSQLATMASRW